MKRKTRTKFISIFVFLVASVIGFSLCPIKTTVAATDSWMPLASLPKSLFYILGAAEVNGCIYFIGNNATLQYIPQTDDWTNMAPLPVYNDGSAVVSCQNKVYVIGGAEGMPT
jgi:hypothetical protein